MNYLDFFASVISSLSWPTSIVAVVWIFRRELRPLLPRMRLKHKDTEIDFRLEEAEKAAENLPLPTHPVPPPSPEEETRFARLARLSPRSAMLEVRMSVEEALKILAERHGRNLFNRQARSQLRALQASNLIDPANASLFEEILTIGAIAAHERDAEFTYDDVMRYRDLAERAINSIAQDVDS